MRRKRPIGRFFLIVLLNLPLLFTCREQGKNAYVADKPGKVFINDPADMARKARALDSLLQIQLRRQGFNGAVLIAHRGQILFEGAVGLASRKAGDSLRTEHLFELASVSKQFTAVAVLQLVEQGKIKLTDSLQQYFPDFPHRGITVHMLLCHRGGLSNYMYDLDRLWPDHSEYPNNQSMLQLITEQPQQPFFPPDRRFDYNNTGYALLALMVEKVSGMPFHRYLKKHIFEPAGMKTAFLMQAGDDLPKLALKGYSGGREITPNYFLNGVVGDKGIYASVHDLYAWEKALFNHVLISEKSMQMALQPYNPERKKSNYGYGWRMYNLPSGKTVYFHGGWWRGFKTLLVHLPDDHTTIIGLSNRTSGAYLNKAAILSILYGGIAATPEDGETE